MFVSTLLALGAMKMASVVPTKTILALRRTLDVGAGETILTADRDLIFNAGFSAVRVRIETNDAVAPEKLSDRIKLLRTTQKVLVLDFTSLPPDVDPITLLASAKKWPDADKLVLQLKSAADVPTFRAEFPANTMILPVAEDAVSETEVIPDGNVIYAFDHIGPEIFQNQPSDGRIHLSETDTRPMFPPQPDRIRQMTGLEPAYREAMLRYAMEKWAVADVRDRLERWVDWGRRHRRYVWWTGLGCSAGAEEASRRQYYQTMARAASHFELGWCLTSYLGPWALAKGNSSSRTLAGEVSAVFSSE